MLSDEEHNLSGTHAMPTGTVKWFNNAKGFGFILPEGGGDDLFAHYSSIEMDGYKTLKAGQTVTYELSNTDKGGHAKQISVVSNEAPSSEQEQDAKEDTEAKKEEVSLAASTA